ncbi:hypothetical protein HID58_059411 [Brassica napus]|uniref:Malectin-like domain-containing protein n=1 Tax=Brassica napus TaxID=3708 RepID=A0ABQ7ZTN1_BRANA|nr:hypothetical protein HID58_059411 [Brassica napus]
MFSQPRPHVPSNISNLCNRHVDADYLRERCGNVGLHLDYDTEFISLACGLVPKHTIYTEKKTKIIYKSDANHIDSGLVGRISHEYTEQFEQQTWTLRSFPEGVGVDSIYEIIHVLPQDRLQVCLVKTGEMTPFINSLEIRPLKNGTYDTQSGSLITVSRFYFPPTKQVISTNSFYDVPQRVVKTAAVPANSSQPLTLNLTLDETTAESYIYMHFAEIQNLEANETREFNVTYNGDQEWFSYFRPPNFKITTASSREAMSSPDGNFNFTLAMTGNSTLPPLINAVEIYEVLDLRQLETDEDEVGSSDVSGSENRGGDQSDDAAGSERGDADASVRQPNTIAYPKKFFESAQAIAAHSHLCWPDLSREWIRRQQARIARVDWESRLPCVLGPRKSRLPLFTRKQQRLLDKAREMDGVPDLSALLKGKLQFLLKKSTTVDPQGPSNSGGDGASEGGGTSREGASKEGASREGAPIVVDEGVGAETSASGPKKKKKSKKTKGRATDEVPPKESASLDVTSEEGREGALVEAAPDGRPKKRTKRSVEAEPRPSTSDTNAADTTLVNVVGEDSGTPENLSEERRKTSTREGGSGDEPVANERSAPDSSARKSSRPERSLAKRRRIEFPDSHVEVPKGGGLKERSENENLEEVPEKDNLEIGDTPVREEETENVGIEDPVLVSDSSSEGREDEEEEDDRAEETSPPQPVEKETTNKVGDRDVPNPPPPTVDSLFHVPTRVEDPAAAATEDPVGPPTLGTPEEDDQDYVP